MLKVENIVSGYGEVCVLQGLSFDVSHQIYTVLGANGAGKSTLLKTIARLIPLDEGNMYFEEEEVSQLPAYNLSERGLAYVPQEDNVFPDLTVKENLSLGGLIGKRTKQERMEEIFELFPDVVDRLDQKAGSLSGGERQMVAVGRALMQDPKMMLLDEPTAGLSPKYVDDFFKRIRDIHEKKDVSVMLAEQNASKALEIADRVMILSLGSIFMIEDVDKVDIKMVKEGYRI